MNQFVTAHLVSLGSEGCEVWSSEGTVAQCSDATSALSERLNRYCAGSSLV